MNIPTFVLTALEDVRGEGQTNMLASGAVIALAIDYGHEDAAEWLKDHPDDYMTALTEMGQLRGG